MVKNKRHHFAWTRYTNSLENFLNKCREVNNFYVQYFSLNIRNINVDIDHLEKAIKTIKGLYIILELENIYEDWEAYKIQFLKDTVIKLEDFSNSNKDFKKENPTEKELELIKLHNQYDLLLYEEMRKVKKRKVFKLCLVTIVIIF